MSWLGKLIATLRPSRLDHALDDELRFHLQQRTDDLIAEGLTPDEAHREAARWFGNLTAIQESTRDRNMLRWLETTLQDLRYAARTLRRNPGFAAAAILSLALGIGANTALFSLIDGLLLKMQPVTDPARLVRLQDGDSEAFAYPTFDLIRTRSRLLSGAIAMSRFYRDQVIDEHGESSLASVQTVSGDYFDLLGVSMARGTSFHRDTSGSPEGLYAVISDSWWRRHYAASPSAVGAHFQRNNRDFIVAGITSPRFQGVMLDAPVDIWLPIEPFRVEYMRGRALVVMGRLQPGVSRAQAAAEASTAAGHAIAMDPGGNGFSRLRGRFTRPLLVLECVAGLVLLIACANLANLMLAAAASRSREIAIRQAIGAGRGRLVRQLLTESLLVSSIGAALAMLVAQWLSRAILRFLPPDATPAVVTLNFRLDPAAFGFTAALALLTALLFGLAPAFRATRQSLGHGLKDAPAGNRASTRWTSRGLVVVEVALCTLLLMSSALFLRSLRQLRTLDTGFVAEHVLVADVSTPRQYPLARLLRHMDEFRAQAAALPGVRAAGTSQIRPLSGFAITGEVQVEGYAAARPEDREAYQQAISPGFLAAMGTSLSGGRDFDPRDAAGTPSVAMVNEAFARQYFAGQSPLGRHFTLEGASTAGPIEIVGVVRDTRWVDLRGKPPAMYYRPAQQMPGGGGTIAVRTAGDLGTLTANLQHLLHQIDPQLALRDVVPFTEMEDRTLVTERMVAQISAAFGALALMVACVGLYGVLAYGVARRTREIGVRMALGASRRGVQWLVLRESLALLGLGFALGIPAALLAARLVASMLFGMSAVDPLALGAALLLMAIVAMAATFVPARRAARVDPMIALRWE